MNEKSTSRETDRTGERILKGTYWNNKLSKRVVSTDSDLEVPQGKVKITISPALFAMVLFIGLVAYAPLTRNSFGAEFPIELEGTFVSTFKSTQIHHTDHGDFDVTRDDSVSVHVEGKNEGPNFFTIHFEGGADAKCISGGSAWAPNSPPPPVVGYAYIDLRGSNFLEGSVGVMNGPGGGLCQFGPPPPNGYPVQALSDGGFISKGAYSHSDEDCNNCYPMTVTYTWNIELHSKSSCPSPASLKSAASEGDPCPPPHEGNDCAALAKKVADFNKRDRDNERSLALEKALLKREKAKLKALEDLISGDVLPLRPIEEIKKEIAELQKAIQIDESIISNLENKQAQLQQEGKILNKELRDSGCRGIGGIP